MFYERAVKCQCGADLPSSVFWQLLRSYSISVANISAITCPIWPKLSHVSVTSWQNDVWVCCCAVDAFRLSLHMRTAQSCCLFQAVAAAVNRKHFTVCHRDLSEKKKKYTSIKQVLPILNVKAVMKGYRWLTIVRYQPAIRSKTCFPFQQEPFHEPRKNIRNLKKISSVIPTAGTSQ